MLEQIGHLLKLRSPRRTPRLPLVRTPPPGVRLQPIRACGAEVVEARLATCDGVLYKESGALRYQAGRHYVVRYENGEEAPVAVHLFEASYRRRFDGKFEKRRDLIAHYFTLPYPVMVATLEGDMVAQTGDWIVQGVTGELYPLASNIGRQKYQPA